MSTTQLAELREKIDQVDAKIAALLNKRAEVAMQIGGAKAKGGSAVYRPAREAEVINNVLAQSDGGLPDESLIAIYREIIAACRNVQHPLRIAYLGPEGTYTEEAARKQYGQTSRYISADSIDQVLQQVDAGGADIAVIPVENSIEGPVNRTLDLLMSTPLTICGETQLPINHQLLSNEQSLKTVTEVIAHPQALAQCRAWLDKHIPQAKRTAASSNAEAVRQAAKRPGAAAIASQRASAVYEVPIIAQNIADDPANTTRFLTLAAQTASPTGQDKTSLICATPNTPGALQKVLAVLAAQNINMVKLESRPAHGALWEYVFYIDVEGHQDDPDLARALGRLRHQTIFLKLLGSYPRAGR
jgi:chorismate mutase/prephenate dehydratase